MNRIKGIYVITDQEIRPDRAHVQIASAAVQGGASIIQLRDKHAADRDFYSWALEIREITSRAGVMFLINDRVHIAKAVSADGVNIGQTDLPVHAARKVLGKDCVIGVSCTSLEEVRIAEKDGADYIGFGPIFGTTTKADAPPDTGLALLQSVVTVSSVPVVAIGGINAKNAPEVIETGADSVCVVSAVVGADNMAEAVRELVKLYTN